jgi:hypothetical protein
MPSAVSFARLNQRANLEWTVQRKALDAGTVLVSVETEAFRFVSFRSPSLFYPLTAGV